MTTTTTTTTSAATDTDTDHITDTTSLREDTMHTFTTPAPIDLRVELWTGRVDVHADDVDETTIELTADDDVGEDAISQTVVEQRGDEIVVLVPRTRTGGFLNFGRKGRITAVIRVPRASNARIETASAAITLRGILANVTLASGSGDIGVAEADSATTRTGSGDIEVGIVHRSLHAKTGSGDLTARSIEGDADITLGSGDGMVHEVAGALKAKSGSGDLTVDVAGDRIDAVVGSGDLTIGRIERGTLRVKTGSGDTEIGIAEGTAVLLDVLTATGSFKSALESAAEPDEGDDTVELSVRSGSGDIALARAERAGR